MVADALPTPRNTRSGALASAALLGVYFAALRSRSAHYLANVAPVLGATGLVALAGQYQVELFWAGLLFNAAGIAFIATRLAKARRAHAHC